MPVALGGVPSASHSRSSNASSGVSGTGNVDGSRWSGKTSGRACVVMGARWAGEEDECLRLSDEIREAMDDVPEHRYYRIQDEVVEAVRHCLAPASLGPEVLGWTAKP